MKLVPGGSAAAVKLTGLSRVQAFDFSAAGHMSLLLLLFSVTVLALANGLGWRFGRRHD
jgi:molybdate transport system permease protein